MAMAIDIASPTYSKKVEFVCGFDFPVWGKKSQILFGWTQVGLMWPFAGCSLTPSSLVLRPRGILGRIGWAYTRRIYRKQFGSEFSTNDRNYSLPWQHVGAILYRSNWIDIKDKSGRIVVQLLCSQKSCGLVASFARAMGITVQETRWLESAGATFQRRRK